MNDCSRYRTQLAGYVADGEPRTGEHAAVRAHLAHCAECQAYVPSLRCVESALHAMPMAVAPLALSDLILDSIADERQLVEEEWRVLPWTVWVPVLAMLFAAVVISMSLPTHIQSALLPPEAQGAIMPIRDLLSVENLPLERPANPDLFWAMWIGIFCTTAGLGISLSLFSWTTGDTKSLEHVESNLSDAVGRLRSRVRRAH